MHVSGTKRDSCVHVIMYNDYVIMYNDYVIMYMLIDSVYEQKIV